MIRWIRTHPWTTATPFFMAGVTVFFHALTGAAWWKSVLFTVAVSGIAALNAWNKPGGRRQ